MIGDSTVGKSSLLKYFVDGKFAEISDPTVGVDFFARLIEVSDGTKIKLQLWDTAGQEKFRSITVSYYRNSVGALLVYDICNKASFDNIPIWMNEAKRQLEPRRPAFALVGCKLDLAKNSGCRAVSTEEAKAFADFHDIPHIETSAKSGAFVEEAFRAVTQQVYNRVLSGEYTVEDGWDGIKKGFSRPDGMDFNLVEAEPARTPCC
ncbi:UNVERIFIED_CONTAM: hypothetical protein PYX00_003258 [Menopon gallinae]|uniref:Ras-related protein Rab-39B n=1 Tax=Menopon gallinae TaxID=328185 RepID=A0AAW2HZT3_9NEOP